MQITIDVPDNLPLEFLKLRIQEIEQNLKSEAKTFAMQQAEITKGDKTIDPTDLFGLWAKQPRNLNDIRKQAWQRSESK
jgi:hypothetical protein